MKKHWNVFFSHMNWYGFVWNLWTCVSMGDGPGMGLFGTLSATQDPDVRVSGAGHLTLNFKSYKYGNTCTVYEISVLAPVSRHIHIYG